MTGFRHVCYFLAMLAKTSSYQEPWMFESPMIKPGSVLNFKNSSTVGEYDMLSWTWAGRNGEIWENHVWHDKDDMGGRFIFKPRMKYNKNLVTLEWEKNRNESATVTFDPETIKQPEWKITVRDVIEVHFLSMDRGWVFKIGDDYFGTGLEYLDKEDELDEDIRRKRSPPPIDSEPEIQNANSFSDSVMDKIMNFFFGDGNAARGEPEGIFNRIGKWLRGISCMINGPCDQPQPSDPPEGPFPPPTTRPPTVLVTFPPLNPNAEVIPELNDV